MKDKQDETKFKNKQTDRESHKINRECTQLGLPKDIQNQLESAKDVNRSDL
jgi:hypothetical protein